MLSRILEYINRNQMINEGDRIAVGVSGGADSVCLLYVLKKLYDNCGVALTAVHVNHGIRGQEADRDEKYVRELCNSLGIEYCCFSYDVRQIAAKQGLSEEEAGRMIRYKTFLEVCSNYGCNKIAVAHNKNDNAETVLFHLFRGTGLKGLSGIGPSRSMDEGSLKVTLIRPLLCMERREIEGFLHKEGIAYQTDSTNLTEAYSRNKIRNKILTYAVEEINTGAVGNISEAAGMLKEAWEYIDSQVIHLYNSLVRKEESSYYVSAGKLVEEPPVIQKGILRKVFENLAGKLKDLEAVHVEAVLSLCSKQVGKRVDLPYGMVAERGYEEIKLCLDKDINRDNMEPQGMEPIMLPVPGRILIPNSNKIIEAELIKNEKDRPIPKSSCAKWFDYDKIENAVEIRTRKEGDYIQINSFGGNKKLKDYFIDHKIPQNQRDSQILITDGKHVMWIPGRGDRMSEKYKVDEATANVLLIRLVDVEENENDR